MAYHSIKNERGLDLQEIGHIADTYLYLIASLATFLLFKWCCNRNGLRIAVLWGKKMIPVHFAALVAVSGVLFSVLWASVQTSELQPKYPSLTMFGSALIAFGLVGPLIEELFFRGLLYETLRTHCHMINAVVISAFVFSASHINFWSEPESLTIVFVLGIITALLAEYMESLSPTFIFHVAVNITKVVDFQFR